MKYYISPSIVTLCMFYHALICSGAGATLPCAQGFFKYHDDGTCRAYFNCNEIDAMEFISAIQPGFTKQFYLVHNGDHRIMLYASPRLKNFSSDFLHGMDMLRRFQGSGKVVDVYGLCFERMQIVMKYHELGSADKLDVLFKKRALPAMDELRVRCQLTLDYLSIISWLHESPAGVRVMCDSNDLAKTLSQFVVTQEWRLLLVDVDALPQVDRTRNQLVKCGHRQLYGPFVAPEQLWPWKDLSYDDALMPHYDEKTDVWKIPDVVAHVLGRSSLGEIILLHSYDILHRCKSHAPEDRPAATAVLAVLADVIHSVTEENGIRSFKEEL